ncbi:hypothetical protein Dda3937_02616 [Dickeya dadantii 3937]|uniref:Uncharacterized protein n=1 Tax=Dickeya dadantii (strain 3937) TaxID=198628 RepID=E0SEE0_DICD3|nr:hypothetical protein Dda3937_02616 [Dickeya dadantii 3937]
MRISSRAGFDLPASNPLPAGYFSFFFPLYLFPHDGNRRYGLFSLMVVIIITRHFFQPYTQHVPCFHGPRLTLTGG